MFKNNRHATLAMLALMSALLIACTPSYGPNWPNPGNNLTAEDIDSSRAIVNGKAIENLDPIKKSIVAVVSSKVDGRSLCTGTLLSSEVVLTAAHCIDDSPAKLSVIFNSNLAKTKESQMHLADAITIHPRWKNSSDDSGRGDLALIHFTGGLEPGFEPVSLANGKHSLTFSTKVFLAGFGVSLAKQRTGDGVLRKTESYILGIHNPTEVVVNGDHKGVCFGDSGGPAFIQTNEGYLQWGIASSVTSQECNRTSIHTSVVPYLEWIETTRQSLSRKTKP